MVQGKPQRPSRPVPGVRRRRVTRVVSALPAGTLLVAGTAWNHNDYTQQSVEVFYSTDHGATWSDRSSCASETGQPNTQGHGIWEPEFTVAGTGDLVCYFSDERPSSNGFAQVLAHVVSTDGGATWGSEVYDVAVQDESGTVLLANTNLGSASSGASRPTARC
jgi:hypothetical protein